MIDKAQETGTVAVIKSPHFDLLTPRVSRRGWFLMLHHRATHKNEMKKKTIKKTNTNQSQY
jgi:hypothetical protein